MNELPVPPSDAPTGELHGWGRTLGTRTHLTTITSADDARAALRSLLPGRGLAPRGLGRSYGDAAQNAGGTTWDLTGLDRILEIDADGEPPTVRLESGVSLDVLMRVLLPMRLWVPVLPGTRQVTIGGAIAADVHGKNHHTQGSFGNHVRAIDLLTADGNVQTVTPDHDADLFWATLGGMGLTGVVLGATVALQRVETSYFTVDTDRTTDFDDLLDRMRTGDENYTYSAAWFDAVTRGTHMGRGVLTRGTKTALDELPRKLRRDPLKFAAPSLGTMPDVFPSGLINSATVKAFNTAWYYKAPRHRVAEVQNITQFFHPLDVMADWNRVYGPAGFLQYQFVVPFDAGDTFRRSFEMIVNSGHPSFLNVLKRFGEGNPSPLSFPMPGWTLTVDLPIADGLDRLCNTLDEMIIGAGGRIYLAKDSRMSADAFRRMYPRLDDFLALRRRVDPDHLFTSDLARRLEL